MQHPYTEPYRHFVEVNPMGGLCIIYTYTYVQYDNSTFVHDQIFLSYVQYTGLLVLIVTTCTIPQSDLKHRVGSKKALMQSLVWHCCGTGAVLVWYCYSVV